MENQESIQKKSKKQTGIDWQGLALQVGTIALQGLVGGVATAVGANVVSRTLSPRSERSVTIAGDNVVRMSKSGAA